jgi:hypothetical protein
VRSWHAPDVVDEFAITHHGLPVEACGKLAVVGDDDDGRTGAMKLEQQLDDAFTGGAVERTCGLVGQEK